MRTDSEAQYHMHNKFMIVDDDFLMTGSFNWTFQAGAHNQENLLVVDHPFYIEKYVTEFDGLWQEFEKNAVSKSEHAAALTIQKNFRSKQSRAPKNAKSAPGYKFQGW